MKTRFAPSPTGYLHLGNIRTALLCYLYARKAGGTFMLRVDDTDLERSKKEYEEAIFEDLKWLGMEPDQVEHQSARVDRYDAAVEKLKAEGRLYPCFETKDELEFKRKMQLGRGQPPIYDRAALKLTADEISKLEAEGKVPHWRFKLNQEQVVAWDDEVRGAQRFEMSHMSDPILVRENGDYTYMLPSTVDDIELEVTHVLRGEDHISNTAIQIQIFEALGGDLPKFAHNALIKSAEGKLSKRTGAGAVRDMREEGLTNMAIVSFLAKLGSKDPVELAESMDELIANFDITKFGKSQTSYSMEDLKRLNSKRVHSMSFNEAKERLAELGLKDIDESFWNVVKANVESFEEVPSWWQICHGGVEPVIAAEDAEFLQSAGQYLPAGELNEGSWKEWVDALKANTDRKGKGLFMPLRKALTGLEHGPELAALLPLIGREKALARLLGKTV